MRLVVVAALCAVAPGADALERAESANVEQNYLLFCGGCHGREGAGVPHRVPPLKGGIGRFLRAEGGRELLLRFPGVANSALSDAALADVMNWCITRFAGSERPAGFAAYSAAEVRAARSSPLLNIQRSRRELMLRAGLASEEAERY